MEKGYFAAAWGDVTRSPGWASKLLRLALVMLVPVFGSIVLYGYLYGWARDIAWNVHRPLPDRIFGNEDGNLYKRGFFILVIGFVFSLIPFACNVLADIASGVSLLGIGLGSWASSDGVVASAGGGLVIGFLLNMVAFVLSLLVEFFAWVGSMRSAVYGTLSSGFQVGKIWAMMRYDFFGLLRILGMLLLCWLVVGVVVVVCAFLIVFGGAVVAFAFASTDVPWALGVVLALLLVAAAVIAGLFVSALISALVARALGYWTRQFEVHLWGGQEDPLPFEQRAAAARAQAQNPAGQQPYQYGQAGPNAQGQWQQPGQPYQQVNWQQGAYGQAQQAPYGQSQQGAYGQGQQAAYGAPPQEGFAQQPAWTQGAAPSQPAQGTPQPMMPPEGAVAGQPVAQQPAAEPPVVEAVPQTPQPAAPPTVEPVPAADPQPASALAAEPAMGPAAASMAEPTVEPATEPAAEPAPEPPGVVSPAEPPVVGPASGQDPLEQSAESEGAEAPAADEADKERRDDEGR